MFKSFLRVAVVVCVINLIISGMLLLNIGAPNPTGRRYSSSEVETRASTNDNGDIGLSGERVLASDLKLPRNDQPDQRVCFCNGPTRYSTSPSACRQCVDYYQGLTATYRRIDFISPSLLGEAKNRIEMRFNDTKLLDQIGDYVLVAKTLGRPLWVYVRLDTQVDPEYYDMVGKTGGGIVHYYATKAGYHDDADRAATNIAAGSGGLLSLILVGSIFSARLRATRSRAQATASAGPSADMKPPGRRYGGGGALDNAIESVKNVREEWRENLDK